MLAPLQAGRVSEERQGELAGVVEQMLSAIVARPGNTRHIPVANADEAMYVSQLLMAEIEGVPGTHHLLARFPTNKAFTEYTPGKVEISLVPRSKEGGFQFKIGTPSPGPAEDIDTLKELAATPTGAHLNPAAAVARRLHDIRTRPSDSRFSDLPWNKVKINILPGDDRVIVKIERRDPNDESTKRLFCADSRGGEELTGLRLNQLAGICKFSIGVEKKAIDGSNQHNVRVSVEFEDFTQERYNALWDKTYRAIEDAGMTGSDTTFTIHGPHEAGIVQRFLSVLRNKAEGGFAYYIPEDRGRMEENYPKEITIKASSCFTLPKYAEFCGFRPGYGGHEEVRNPEERHRAPRGDGRYEESVEPTPVSSPTVTSGTPPTVESPTKEAPKPSKVVAQKVNDLGYPRTPSGHDVLSEDTDARKFYDEANLSVSSISDAIDAAVSTVAGIAEALQVPWETFRPVMELTLQRSLKEQIVMVGNKQWRKGLVHSFRTFTQACNDNRGLFTTSDELFDFLNATTI